MLWKKRIPMLKYPKIPRKSFHVFVFFLYLVMIIHSKIPFNSDTLLNHKYSRFVGRDWLIFYYSSGYISLKFKTFCVLKSNSYKNKCFLVSILLFTWKTLLSQWSITIIMVICKSLWEGLHLKRCRFLKFFYFILNCQLTPIKLFKIFSII